jgi:hypothetical protein
MQWLARRRLAGSVAERRLAEAQAIPSGFLAEFAEGLLDRRAELLRQGQPPPRLGRLRSSRPFRPSRPTPTGGSGPWTPSASAAWPTTCSAWRRSTPSVTATRPGRLAVPPLVEVPEDERARQEVPLPLRKVDRPSGRRGGGTWTRRLSRPGCPLRTLCRRQPTPRGRYVRCCRKRSPAPEAAGGVQLPPVRAGELPLQSVAELGAHVGHRRPLQGQRLLALDRGHRRPRSHPSPSGPQPGGR